jgi:hypothetical protein
MSAGIDLYNSLKGLVSGRMFPKVAPLGIDAPYIIYSQVVGTPENSLDGDSGLTNYRMQVDYYHNTYGEAKVLAESGRGVMKIAAYRPLLLLEVDWQDPDTGLYKFTQDYSIWINE